MKVNLRNPLLVGWYKNETLCAVFVTLMMGKGNAPVLGSGRTHDFGKTKSGNRSSRQPTIQEIVAARVPPESHAEPRNVFWKTRSELSLRDSSRGLASGVESAIHGQDCSQTRSILHKPSLMALVPFRVQFGSIPGGPPDPDLPKKPGSKMDPIDALSKRRKQKPWLILRFGGLFQNV